MTQYHAFYDTETTGPTPRYDQILQAAGILTDDDFMEIDQIDARSRLSHRIVPTAGALKVTGVNPYDLARAPHDPHSFAKMLHERFQGWAGRGDILFSGYNILNFDEEILRQTFWENLLDPYLSSGRGRGRNDLLPVVRALYARNPDCLEVARDPETGKANFKLETLAPLNGFAGHDAHDALGDVRATIFVARLVRDTDPALWAHMTAMGNANAARDFVDRERLIRLLGGPMTNPGILDCMLVASQADNPKNKSAFNLAVDPVPYLDLGPEEILAAMKKSGTPFRTVKCNKQPAAFPMGWEFLNRVSSDAFEPADPATIEARAEMIAAHDGFRANTAEALRLKVEGYDPATSIEEKIYEGFPSNADKAKMRDFHAQPDWARKLEIVRDLADDTQRALGLRLVYDNAPDALTAPVRTACAERLAEERFTLAQGKPWTTVGDLMDELDTLEEKTPGDPDLATIRAWALETYPAAGDWAGAAVAQEVSTSATPETPALTGPAQPCCARRTEEASPTPPSPAGAAPSSAPAPHFLDGLD